MTVSLRAAEERPAFRNLSGMDWSLVVASLLLAAIGTATVHSASSAMPTDYMPRQALWVGIGALLMILAGAINYRALVDLAVAAYLGGVGLLVLVLLVGRVGGGARSWLGYGAFGLQPAEVAKLTTALLLATYLANVNRSHAGLKEIGVCALLAAVPMGLIALQPDLGSAAMFVPIVGGMLLVAGVRWRVILTGLLIVALVAGALWFFGMQDYQRQRVETFLNPSADPLGAGYQVQQSKIAVGSGQLNGKGYMQGTQSQLRFLPARHTDFVFAVLAEEWGFVGVIVVLILYAVWIINGLRIAQRARERVAVLLITGLVSLFAFHVLYNTAMVVGFLPITGIPLPFLSYGGSFTLVNFFITGLILSIDARRYVNA
jgi:rod shape determining protein RodA